MRAAEQVLVGLWSRDFCNAMAARKHEDVDKLLHDILEYEMVNVQPMERIRAQRDVKGENQKKLEAKHRRKTRVSRGGQVQAVHPQ